MKRKILIVGAGGLAREFATWFQGEVEIVGVSAASKPTGAATALADRHFDNHVLPDVVGTDQCVVAVGDPASKRHLHELLGSNGWQFPTLVHKTAIVAENVSLGDGVVVSPGSVIGADAVVGDLTYLNFQVGIGHDAVLGRYVQVNPGAQVGGSAKVGDVVLLGSNSSILQGLSVGDGATVGIGAVCLSRVPAGTTVVGNPAKKWWR